MTMKQEIAIYLRVLRELLEIIDPLEKDGYALTGISTNDRAEMQRWLIRLKEQYTEWEAPDEDEWEDYN